MLYEVITRIILFFHPRSGPACKGAGIKGTWRLGSPVDQCIYEHYRNRNFNGNGCMGRTDL